MLLSEHLFHFQYHIFRNLVVCVPVNAHLAAVGLAQLLPGDDLEQLQQLPPVP